MGRHETEVRSIIRVRLRTCSRRKAPATRLHTQLPLHLDGFTVLNNATGCPEDSWNSKSRDCLPDTLI
jgi:hypothetical protein